MYTYKGSILRFKFADKDLQKLYETGENRKFSYPADIIRRFIQRVEAIKAAETTDVLRKMRSHKFEKLKGCDNRFSMRINDQYRLEMTLEDEGGQIRLKIFVMRKISKHYE